jgi:ABC-2 type transport system permease protein
MKSKVSYFSISRPLIIENLRRFWAIPALAFLVYFLSGVFPILMSYRHLDTLSSYIVASLNNQQPFYMFAHLIFPVVAAVVIFRYLQGISSVSVVHSMPFTRLKLYNSGIISGFILIISPILVNGLILLAISKPIYNQYDNGYGIVTETVNLFSRTDILNWVWISILITASIFAVAVFAGIVTGNSLMHFATAVWFNFLIPALYAVFIAYFSHYLFGFDTSGNWTEYGMKISPFLNVLQSAGKFGLWVTLYYIASILIIFVLTGFLYHKRRLERATDSLVFGFMEPIICYLIAFLGMTLLGFYFQALGNSEFYMYAGFAAGTLIFFIIGQMIVKKTPRIYNLRSLRSFGIYALIALIFLLGLTFDLTGFEKRVPPTGDVSSFTLTDDFSIGSNPNVNYVNGRPVGTIFGDGEALRFKDPDNIKAVTALHKALIADQPQLKSLDNMMTANVYLAYNPDSAFPLSRLYRIDYDFYKNSAEFKQLYESKEYKAYYAPSNLKYSKMEDLYISSDAPVSETIHIRNAADIKEFISCLDADYKQQSFEDMISLKHPYATADISFAYENKDSGTPDHMTSTNVMYKITDNYTNTLSWLENHGYGGKFTRKADDVAYIELYHSVQTNDPGVQQVQQEGMFTTVTKTSTVSEESSLKITDPAKIQQLLDTYETQNTNFNDYYYGTIVYNGGSTIQDPAQFYKEYGVEYTPETAEKYAMESGSMVTMQIYFNEGNIPDYILDYFKQQ